MTQSDESALLFLAKFLQAYEQQTGQDKRGFGSSPIEPFEAASVVLGLSRLNSEIQSLIKGHEGNYGGDELVTPAQQWEEHLVKTEKEHKYTEKYLTDIQNKDLKEIRLSCKNDGPKVIRQINGEIEHLLIDSGASKSVLSTKYKRRRILFQCRIKCADSRKH